MTLSDLLTGLLATGTAMALLIAALLGSGMWSPELTRRWPGRLRGCLSWEPELPHGRHAATRPRTTPARPYWRSHPWRALRLRVWARHLRRDNKLRERAAAACASPDGTAPVPPAPGAVPLHIRATSSGGFPSVAFRAELPDVIA